MCFQCFGGFVWFFCCVVLRNCSVVCFYWWLLCSLVRWFNWLVCYLLNMYGLIQVLWYIVGVLFSSVVIVFIIWFCSVVNVCLLDGFGSVVVVSWCSVVMVLFQVWKFLVLKFLFIVLCRQLLICFELIGCILLLLLWYWNSVCFGSCWQCWISCISWWLFMFILWVWLDLL